MPLIGASGAVAGVIGAYVVLHPNIRVWVLFPVPLVSFLPLRISAAFVIGMWIIYQIASGIFLTGEATAWWAHVGGFFAGALSRHHHETAWRPPFRCGDRHAVIAGRMSNLRLD